MRKSKINPPTDSKLSKAIHKMKNNDLEIEKTGFIDDSHNKTTHYKIKTFRLRQLDAANLEDIVKEVNKNNLRKSYSDSEVIRGLINYVSNNLNKHIKKLTENINNSS